MLSNMSFLLAVMFQMKIDEIRALLKSRERELQDS